MSDNKVKVGIIMGSKSDWPVVQKASDILKDLGVEHECEIVSAHRTPDKLSVMQKLHPKEE